MYKKNIKITFIIITAILVLFGATCVFTIASYDSTEPAEISLNTSELETSKNQDYIKPQQSTEPQQSTDSQQTTEPQQSNDSQQTQPPEVNSTSQEVSETQTPKESPSTQSIETCQYKFRSESQFIDHYNKHGAEFGYTSSEEYLKGANRVISSSEALQKTEAEDGDYIYYIESTNEFVVLSTDGYIRTYFKPSGGIDYYNRQ